jgi:hypothetical protein
MASYNNKFKQGTLNPLLTLEIAYHWTKSDHCTKLETSIVINSTDRLYTTYGNFKRDFILTKMKN